MMLLDERQSLTGCLDFSGGGSTTYISIPQGSLDAKVSAISGTVAMWLYFTRDDSANPGICAIQTTGGGFGSGTYMNLDAFPTNFQIKGNGGTSADILVPSVNNWYFVAMSLTAATATGYVRQKSTWATASITNGSAHTGQSIYIGNCYPDSSSLSEAWQGYIAGVKIWNNALSAKELFLESRQLAPILSRGLVSYMRMPRGRPTVDDFRLSNGWTKAGTIANAARNPPVPEILNPKRLIFLSSAAGGLLPFGWSDDVPVRALAPKRLALDDAGPFNATAPFVSTSDFASSAQDEPRRILTARAPRLEDAGPIDRLAATSLGSSWGAFVDEPRHLPTTRSPKLDDPSPIDATQPNLGTSWGAFPDDPVARVTKARPWPLAEPGPFDATAPNLGTSWGTFADEPRASVTRQRPAVLPEPGPFDGTQPNLGSSWGFLDDGPPARVTRQRPAPVPDALPVDATQPNLGSSWGVFADAPVARVVAQRPAPLPEPLPLDATRPNLGTSWGAFADDVVAHVTRARPGPSTEADVPPRLLLPTLADAGWWDLSHWLPAPPPKPIPEGPALAAVTVVVLPNAGWVADEPRPRRAVPQPVSDAGPPLADAKAPLATLLLEDLPAPRARPGLALRDDGLLLRAIGQPSFGWQDGAGPPPPRRAGPPSTEAPHVGAWTALAGLGWLADAPPARSGAGRTLPAEDPTLRRLATGTSLGWLPDEPRPRLPGSRPLQETGPLDPATIVHLVSIGWLADDVIRPMIRAHGWLPPIDDLVSVTRPLIIAGPVRAVLRELVVTAVHLGEMLATSIVLEEG